MESVVYAFVLCAASFFFLHVSGQTLCAVNLPVSDRGVCDAGGLLEVHIDSNVHETMGIIKATQEYQDGLFKLFDQQFTTILDEATQSDANVLEVEEEIKGLVDIFNNIKALHESANHDQETDVDDDYNAEQRDKRAATTTQTQNLLNAAKLAFQQAIADTGLKLQNLTNSLQDDMQRNAVIHSTMETELAKNKQDLLTTEQLLQQIDHSIQQAQNSTKSGGGGASLTGVNQDVTQLIIDGATAEQVAQRQLDVIEKALQKLETDEAAVTANVQSLNGYYNKVKKTLDNDTQQVAILKGSEKFNENQQLQFLNKMEGEVTKINADIPQADKDVASVGRQLFTVTLNEIKYAKDLLAYRNVVDGVQSIITFTKKAEQTQIVKLLNLKKTAMDNINAMKYAFGILKSLP